jgi:hypothetical protein
VLCFKPSISLHLFSLIIFGNEYKLRRSTMCNLPSPLSLHPSQVQTFPSTPYSQTSSEHGHPLMKKVRAKVCDGMFLGKLAIKLQYHPVSQHSTSSTFHRRENLKSQNSCILFASEAGVVYSALNCTGKCSVQTSKKPNNKREIIKNSP